MPFAIFGDRKNGLPKSSGRSSIQTFSSFCYSVNEAVDLRRVLDHRGERLRAARRRHGVRAAGRHGRSRARWRRSAAPLAAVPAGVEDGSAAQPPSSASASAMAGAAARCR